MALPFTLGKAFVIRLILALLVALTGGCALHAPWVCCLPFLTLALIASWEYLIVMTLWTMLTGAFSCLLWPVPVELFLVPLVLLAALFCWRGRLTSKTLSDRGSRIVSEISLVLLFVFLALLLCRRFPFVCGLGGSAISVLAFAASRHAFIAGIFFRKLAYVILVAILSGGISEVSARLLLRDVQRPGATINIDPDYVFLPKPGGRLRVTFNVSPTEKRHVLHQLSEQGLRDRYYGPKAPNEFRILMLGDSFTQGYPVAPEDTIPKALERMLAENSFSKQVSVINAGCIAAGPIQELGILRTIGLSLKPDLVILQLFPSNDIEDSLGKSATFRRAYNEQGTRIKYRVARGCEFPFRAELFLRRHSHLYCALCTINDRNWVALLFYHCRIYPEFARPELPPSEDRPFFLEMNLKNWYPELEQGFALLQHYVREIRDECRQHDIDLIVYCIPECNDVSDSLWSRWTSEYPNTYERWKSVDMCERFLAQEGIRCISLRDMLRDYPKIEDVYFIMDGHTTEKGNTMIADKIRDYLDREYFPARLGPR